MKGNLIEGISSNIFLIKGSTLTTPGLSEGPVAGIMRKQILRIANSVGFKINHESAVTENNYSMPTKSFYE